MLFNSPEFIFGFLPIVTAVVWIASKTAGKLSSVAALILASLIFYGWWSPTFLLLIVASTIINYYIARVLLTYRSRTFMLVGVAFNLGLLGYFKYIGFFIGIFAALSGQSFSPLDVALPLGISFFVFQKIAFIVDAYRGRIDRVEFVHYGLFVIFFPQLIAGPIVHHQEFIPQVRRMPVISVRGADLAIGIAIFAVGLFKKTVIADTLGKFADPVFANTLTPYSAVEVWGALLCFTFQIYFDFSGYSDMAIGLARIFGLRLPANFSSPYKAMSIIEFWRCWHMTLSRFLRNYLYISLGGNRKGPVRRHANLMITMVLGGLWHGANWTFVIWGALHGFYLIVNHVYRALCRHWRRDHRRATPLERAAGRALTFLAVVFAWLFFRATDFSSAMVLLHALLGANGFMPSAITPFREPEIFIWLGLLLAITWFAPNIQQWFAAYQPVLPDSLQDVSEDSEGRTQVIAGSCVLLRDAFFAFTAMSGIVAVIVMLARGAPTSFIYFVF